MWLLTMPAVGSDTGLCIKPGMDIAADTWQDMHEY